MKSEKPIFQDMHLVKFCWFTITIVTVDLVIRVWLDIKKKSIKNKNKDLQIKRQLYCIPNVFFQGGKVTDVILIDWQIVRFASPATDIAYMLCFSLDEKLLDLHLNDLLDLYYSSLQKAITSMGCDPNICYPEEVFREHFKTKMSFGLMMAFVTIPFILSEAREARNTEEIMDDMNKGVNCIKIGEVAAKRLNSVINYFVKHDLV